MFQTYSNKTGNELPVTIESSLSRLSGAAQRSHGPQSAVCPALIPCFVVAFGAIIARRLPGPRAVIGVLLSAAGVAVLGGTHSVLGFGPWNLVVLGGVACAGLCNVLTDRGRSTPQPRAFLVNPLR